MMKFEKEVLFLGRQEMHMSDGGVYYAIQLYDKDSGPVNVNVMSNSDNVGAFIGLDFGSPLVVTFVLRAAEKQGRWRLGVDHVG